MDRSGSRIAHPNIKGRGAPTAILAPKRRLSRVWVAPPRESTRNVPGRATDNATPRSTRAARPRHPRRGFSSPLRFATMGGRRERVGGIGGDGKMAARRGWDRYPRLGQRLAPATLQEVLLEPVPRIWSMALRRRASACATWTSRFGTKSSRRRFSPWRNSRWTGWRPAARGRYSINGGFHVPRKA